MESIEFIDEFFLLYYYHGTMIGFYNTNKLFSISRKYRISEKSVHFFHWISLTFIFVCGRVDMLHSIFAVRSWNQYIGERRIEGSSRNCERNGKGDFLVKEEDPSTSSRSNAEKRKVGNIFSTCCPEN